MRLNVQDVNRKCSKGAKLARGTVNKPQNGSENKAA